MHNEDDHKNYMRVLSLASANVALHHCLKSACVLLIVGNHILPDEDLAAFHWSLLGPDHPLASLKVQ